MKARALLTLWLVLALAPLARARGGEKSLVDELLERGLRSYAIGSYDDAIASFKSGYEMEPRPEFLYALGQAQRMNKDCRGAVASYRAFLRTSPQERAAAPARQNLARCEEVLKNTPPPPPDPAVTGAVVTERPPAPPPPPRKWHKDRAGAVVAGFGAAAIVAGAVLWGVGEAGAREIADARRYDEFAQRVGGGDGYERERLAGIVCVSVGGALVVGAVARWAWVARHR